jgi:RNA polymerase sigma factor (TIGR02999 family)
VEERAPNVTQLLIAVRDGDSVAQSKLYQAVYAELHRIAARYMRRERPDHTLQATALIHEAYVDLIDQHETKQWQNRAHFYAVAANVMRRILVDHARTHRTAKRGGGGKKLSLDEAVPVTSQRSDELLAVDEALSRLAEFDPRQSKVVELRFFAGFTDDETAEVLGVSSRTVKRDWRLAKAWLYSELNR